jgi:hypothetical protein
MNNIYNIFIAKLNKDNQTGILPLSDLLILP